MKKCCKNPDNWINNGTKEKVVTDVGKTLEIKSKNYITCAACKNRMFLLNNRKLVDAT